ncbi:murein biosynthesis integral membrane protein MurJ [Heliobacterium gestii]|uniref:Probable lipid II flippase MurJ n=1 Tax=Heliomicrobium gestii TaxID=2699 RepID=A0A845LI84_HELGE|nr:murein biosynthesis integral membrane protein MurJ [Heliomicrobium gestii]MBM7868013.1 putative peptidoglycan lipid II flippase [Heliomicrobium gestii]MZP44279.1 murein biosynthesis integral membrane protein MurJ [Heliomicrobium gestii]
MNHNDNEGPPPSRGGQRIAKAAGSIMLAMLISRILGFVREAVIGAKFGQNAITDSYNAAFALPDFLYFLLVGGALSTAFIPVFSSYVATDKENDGWIVASTFVNAMILLLSAGIILGEIFTPQLIPLVAYGFQGDTLERTVFLTRIMFPSVLFTGLAGLAMGVLNSYQHFLMPSIGAILYNVVIILCGYFLSDTFGIAAFSIGVVLGAFVNFLVQVPMLLRVGLRYQMVMRLDHPGVLQIAKLMGPALLGLSIGQIQDIINQNLASALEPGSISALRWANRLMQLPLGVFAIAISVAVFPSLTSAAARREWLDFRRNLSLGLRTVIYITVPAAVGMAILRVPIVQVLFERDKFDHTATLATASVLLFFLIGLFAQGANQLLPRVFYALQRPSIPVRVSTIILVVNTALSLVMIRYWGAEGVAMAFSLSAIVAFGLFLILARRALRSIDGGRLMMSLAKTLTASAIMGAVIMALQQFIGALVDMTTLTGQLVLLTITVSAGAGVYALATYLMKMEEADMVARTFLSRFTRR